MRREPRIKYRVKTTTSKSTMKSLVRSGWELRSATPVKSHGQLPPLVMTWRRPMRHKIEYVLVRAR